VDIRPSTEDFQVTATSAAPRLARRRVNEACVGLTDDLRSVAELLTSELVANAVRHTRRDGSDGGADIEVTIQRTEQALRVEVRDHDDQPLPPVAPPDSPREGGMGLHLVDVLSGAWGWHLAPSRGGKVVWFEIAFPGSHVADAEPGADR
jgi:anti-sigma regulatory factor (Ser/Thr protein kinase)